MKHFLIAISLVSFCAISCNKGDNPVPAPGATDLSANGTANCYIVSAPGSYKFKTVKGNFNISVGNVTDATVVWESFGTEDKPVVGSLVKNARCEGEYIIFDYTGKKGNALIAAKNDKNIIWSWHIWCCADDVPKGQEYFNNDKKVLDRNLGATSTAVGSTEALGLLYQWGRKDPFLGGKSNSNSTPASSNPDWWSSVESSSTTGTIDYANAHPTNFITAQKSGNGDWQYIQDNTRWQEKKMYYDPCPPGWKVAPGGTIKDGNIWSKAFGTDEATKDQSNWLQSCNGMNFGISNRRLGDGLVIWYPAAGYRDCFTSELSYVGTYGYYWTSTINGNEAHGILFQHDGSFSPQFSCYRANAHPVRCVEE